MYTECAHLSINQDAFMITQSNLAVNVPVFEIYPKKEGHLRENA